MIKVASVITNGMVLVWVTLLPGHTYFGDEKTWCQGRVQKNLVVEQKGKEGA